MTVENNEDIFRRKEPLGHPLPTGSDGVLCPAEVDSHAAARARRDNRF